MTDRKFRESKCVCVCVCIDFWKYIGLLLPSSLHAERESEREKVCVWVCAREWAGVW